jgi:hypothetical protein
MRQVTDSPDNHKNAIKVTRGKQKSVLAKLLFEMSYRISVIVRFITDTRSFLL